MDLAAQCDLVAAASYLRMDLFLMAIASRKRTWSSISVMGERLPADAYRFMVYNVPGMTILERFADTEDKKTVIKLIRALLLRGGNATLVSNARWGDARNVVHWAVVNREKVVLRLLLDAPGINVNEPDDEGGTPLHVAVQLRYEDEVRLLLDAPGINVNEPDGRGRTPLHVAVLLGHDKEVRLLLKSSGVNVNARDDFLKTPLHVAVFQAIGEVHGQTMKRLLKHPDVDVNTYDHDMKTPLHEAVFLGNPAILRLLLKHPKINVNVRGHNDKTPLHWAAFYAQKPVVFELLLNTTGIDVYAKDDGQWTALHWAMRRGDAHVVSLLMKHASPTMRLSFMRRFEPSPEDSKNSFSGSLRRTFESARRKLGFPARSVSWPLASRRTQRFNSSTDLSRSSRRTGVSAPQNVFARPGDNSTSIVLSGAPTRSFGWPSLWNRFTCKF